MRKEDLSVPALFLEAIVMILGLVYIGLQIFYGIYYHIAPYKYIMNLLMMALVYVLLSILSVYPERINGLPSGMCVGKVRSYSLWMVRLVKAVFVISLLIPCICDVIGVAIQSVYSLIVIGIIIVIAVYCEYQIIQELKRQSR